MSVIGHNSLVGSSGQQGYTVNRSLRFRSSASSYLSRTLSVSGNTRTFTQSAWVKRGALGTEQYVFFVFNGGNTLSYYWVFQSNNTLRIVSNIEGISNNFDLTTTQVFRDPSAWYHILVAVDTTQATSSNRIKLYVNGVQVTSFSTATYPSLNFSNSWNATGYTQYIGRNGSTLDGYLAEVYAIDGQALTPSSFGAYDNNGVWQPIKYAGTYGTNGFYLPFSNTTSTTTLVQDSSGNGNNWTANNISLTAGTTYDSMIDSPTVSASASNYCVMNPLDSLNGTASNGNLLWTATASQSDIRGTIAIPSSGKFYMECTVGSTTSGSSAVSFGLATSTVSLSASNAVAGLYQLYASSSGYLSLNGTNVSSSLGTWTAGDILQIAVDATNTKMWLGKNNTWYDSSGGTTGNPSTGANATSITSMVGLFPFSNCYQNNATWNFGQRPFSYTPPTGFNALNTYNLPAPSIANGAQYMAATTYTGNGSTLSVNNGNNTTIGTTFQPDFVWIKGRNAVSDNGLSDSLRQSSGLGYVLYSNLTNAESLGGAYVYVPFNSNGFTTTSNTSANTNGNTYVGWQWKAGGTGVTNTSGTITSTVSANPTAGFSVVTYTGTGSAGTIGHGLGVAPSMIIVKRRSTTGNWPVYHTSLGNATSPFLNLINAANSQPNLWNSTTPTSSVFTVGTDTETNQSSQTLVAYCFAAVSGYSAFGSYTGNGSTDGTFVYTGFRPRWVMMKRSSDTGYWAIKDSSRNGYNQTDPLLYANISDAEYSAAQAIDILSNGFKLRSTGLDTNGSGSTYIYAAFAENPFNNSRGR